MNDRNIYFWVDPPYEKYTKIVKRETINFDECLF